MKKKEQKKEKQFKKVWEKLWQNVIGRLPEVDIKRLFLTNLPYVLVFYIVNNWHGFISIAREILYWNV